MRGASTLMMDVVFAGPLTVRVWLPPPPLTNWPRAFRRAAITQWFVKDEPPTSGPKTVQRLDMRKSAKAIRAIALPSISGSHAPGFQSGSGVGGTVFSTSSRDVTSGGAVLG